jgi:hypothetical protein
MKIKRISQTNQFEDEGRDSLELPERDQFEAQQEMEDQRLGKKSPTYTAEVLNKAMNALGNRINSSFVVEGSVGWIEYNGIIYEILVAPAARGKYFSYFQSLQKPTTDTPESPENTDDLP